MTISATRIPLARLFMSDLHPVVNSDNTLAVGKDYVREGGWVKGILDLPSRRPLMKRRKTGGFSSSTLVQSRAAGPRIAAAGTAAADEHSSF
jgi:hypothetical protein